MVIQEAYMYYFWRLQHFMQHTLTTLAGEPLTILHPGTRNEHAGPDFLYAHIKIGALHWYGHVELHTYASAWYAHAHHHDPVYESVVLHVIWYNDKPITRSDQTHLPTLLLAPHVDPALIKNCDQFMEQVSDIYCAQHITTVPNVIRRHSLDTMLRQRFQRKHTKVYQLLANNQGDWEATTYQLLAYNFGFSINSDAMLSLSMAIPYRIIRHQRDDLRKIEALLFGQAGLLATDPPAASDAYHAELLQHYAYLAHKYQLTNKGMDKVQWKFFRLRPANFPTVRIAQLAQLLWQLPALFSWLLDTSIAAIQQHLSVTQSAYWQHHYVFGKASKQRLPGLGKSSIHTIFINTVVPLLMAYGHTQHQPLYIEKAIAMLQALPPEDNSIIRKWKALDMHPKNAFDSQAFIELYQHACTQKQCRSCSIGNYILQGAKTPRHTAA